MVDIAHISSDEADVPAEVGRTRRRERKAWRVGWLVRDLKGWMFAVPAVVCLIVYEWGPLVTTVKDSFYNMIGFNTDGFVGLSNFTWVIHDPEFVTVLLNTLKYVGWSILIGFPLPIIVAIAISELPRLNGFFRVLVYLPALVPSVITSVMWTEMYSATSSGLVNRFLGLFGFSKSQLLLNPHLTIPLIVISMTWTAFGATTILYTAAISGVNRTLYEAAALDGAGFLRRVWHVTLPQLRKLIGLFLILQIVGVFQVLVQPLVMTNGGPDQASESLLLFTYNLAFRYYKTGASDAVGVITFLLLLGMTAFYLRANFGQRGQAGRRLRRARHRGA